MPKEGSGGIELGKEMIICILIVIAIVGGNIYTQNYTVESVEEMTSKLDELKSVILKVKNGEIDKEKIKIKLEETKKQWEMRHDKLAYFIEHDELEKVETNLTGLNSFIETEEYSKAISELDKSNFILEHIQEKYAFNLENIF